MRNSLNEHIFTDIITRVIVGLCPCKQEQNMICFLQCFFSELRSECGSLNPVHSMKWDDVKIAKGAV